MEDLAAVAEMEDSEKAIRPGNTEGEAGAVEAKVRRNSEDEEVALQIPRGEMADAVMGYQHPVRGAWELAQACCSADSDGLGEDPVQVVDDIPLMNRTLIDFDLDFHSVLF